MSTKGCSLPMPNFPEVSIFPFHVLMGNAFLFFLFPATFALLINYGRQIWEKKTDENLCGVIIPKGKLYFFFCIILQVK